MQESFDRVLVSLADTNYDGMTFWLLSEGIFKEQKNLSKKFLEIPRLRCLATQRKSLYHQSSFDNTDSSTRYPRAPCTSLKIIKSESLAPFEKTYRNQFDHDQCRELQDFRQAFPPLQPLVNPYRGFADV